MCRIDTISYTTIASLPNNALADLFNKCIAQLDASQDWFTMVLVGILKKDKPATDPESYHLIGLEYCLLKVLTLLIDKRIRDWADAYSVLLDSQNGFWEQYQTHNNLFILRYRLCHTNTKGSSTYFFNS